MRGVWLIDALRTPVAPRGGAYKLLGVDELGGSVIRELYTRLRVPVDLRCEVILGNALYGGGNPARVVALAGGLPEEIPAFTLDTQCCSGLDAIAFAAARIESGQADMVFAGGVESWSRSPFRLTRPLSPDGVPQPYERPPFTPWPDRDPDLVLSAAQLAERRGITRVVQETFAVDSHVKALNAHLQPELLGLSGIEADTFTRQLSMAACARIPSLSGIAPFDLTSATVSVQADAAAMVVLVNESSLDRAASARRPVRIAGADSAGFDPTLPALAPSAVTKSLLSRLNWSASTLHAVEIMEAFAVQALAFIEDLGLKQEQINRGGGALARGHPIGASGAVLAVRLFHEMQNAPRKARGLAAIAAAGGLGTALAMEI